MKTDYEWLHVLIGSFFVLSLVSFTVYILCAEDVHGSCDDNDDDNDEQDKNNNAGEQRDIEAADIDMLTDKKYDNPSESVNL